MAWRVFWRFPTNDVATTWAQPSIYGAWWWSLFLHKILHLFKLEQLSRWYQLNISLGVFWQFVELIPWVAGLCWVRGGPKPGHWQTFFFFFLNSGLHEIWLILRWVILLNSFMVTFCWRCFNHFHDSRQYALELRKICVFYFFNLFFVFFLYLKNWCLDIMLSLIGINTHCCT